MVLKGLDPVLGPDLLHVLRAMGHGDEMVIADATFPALAMARRLVRLDGVDGPRALGAILSVLPLDDFIDSPCLRMQVVGDPAAERSVIDDAADRPIRLASIERFAFYERARKAFAIVQTGETRLYGNLILVKGIIRPT